MSNSNNHSAERYPEQLVLRVNELFYDHDSANHGYADIHKEMLEQERERWQTLAKRHIASKEAITLLDIGSGAGFVPVTVAPYLKAEDTIICSDLSEGMLNTARQTIAEQQLPPRFQFQKITGEIPYRLPFQTNSMDVVTMNSVLHHIKETKQFLSEVDRVLKPGGMLFIAHEPNKHFHQHTFLRRNYRLLRPVGYPKLALMEAARRLGIMAMMRKAFYVIRPDRGKVANTLIDRINDTLIAEKLITKPISLDEVATITDIRDSEGFFPEQLLPEYEVRHLETYNHILLVTMKHFGNRLVRRYELWLRKKYPTAGATFFLVLGKPQQAVPGT